MGIFRKKDQPEDNLIIEDDFVPSDIDDDKTILTEDLFSDDEADIGFHTGILKGNFANIKNDSETLDVIKKIVEKRNTDNNSDEDQDDIIEFDMSEAPEESKDPDDDYDTLLKKCKAYTTDENGKNYAEDNDPLYKLSTVAEILKSDQVKALDSLSKKFDIEVSDETSPATDDDISDLTPDPGNDFAESGDSPKTAKFVMLTEEGKTERSDDIKLGEFIKRKNPDAIVEEVDTSIPDISDIDNAQKIATELHDHSSDGATLKYTPIKDTDGKKAHISISTTTQNIDIREKLNLENPDSISSTSKKPKKQEDGFDDFSVDNEINDRKDISANIKKYSVKKRNAFISVILSFFFTAVTAITALSLVGQGADYSNTVLITLLVFYVLNVITNYSMFSSLKSIAKKTSNADITAVVISVSTIAMAIIMIIKPDGNFSSDVYLLMLLSAVILCLRSLSAFFDVSARLGNLKVLSSKLNIYGVDFIDDQSIAYSIAKDSVEGDILIAAPHKTSFINSFNKYSSYTTLLSGRFNIFYIIALVVSLIVAIIGLLKFKTFVGGMYCFVALQCVLAFPVIFFVNTLPCYSAAKKLNKNGAAIFGTAGATHINDANAVIISTEELFPSGSIVLKDMKILSDNIIDETILKAASLTEAIGSPLTPIFKKIAKTDKTFTLPDSDTVKYEDTLGISGWVDNELLFIGNRSLMVSHGIEVPSYEVDKKILESGYFPIYVATVDKACALLIVKYNPSYRIAKELRKLSCLGVTLLFINNDPNINKNLIVDYFDLYEDSIKIVSNAGKYMYENSVVSDQPISAPAAFRRHNLSFIQIMNCASSIKKSNTLFSIIYIIASILLAVGFIYLRFDNDSNIFQTGLLLSAELISSLITIIIYLFKKP